MFAYCENSSVNCYDPNGYDREFVDFLDRCLSGGVGRDMATAGLGALLWNLGVSAFDATAAFMKSVGDSVAQSAEKTTDRYLRRTHYVYHLTDSNKTVQYVGRTQHLSSRKNAHKNSKHRGHLEFNIVTPELTYYEARAVEQASMLYHHTLNTSKKMHNQINGVAPKYWDSYKTIAMGVVGYVDNQISNEVLWWAEG